MNQKLNAFLCKVLIWVSVQYYAIIILPVDLAVISHVTRNYTALILARGGSKQVPRKNLAVVGDKTLLRRSIEIAKLAGVFSSVWVSTDDLEIYNEARISGANVYARSEENASDTASSLDAVLEFYSYFQNLSSVALIQCTSPFLSPLDLRQAHFMMEMLDYNSVFSVSYNHNLRWRKNANNTVMPVNFDPKSRPRRQELRREYTENGMFYWFTTDLIEDNLLQGGKIGVIEIQPERSLEIDTIEDLHYARFLAPKLLPVIEHEASMCFQEEFMVSTRQNSHFVSELQIGIY